MHHRTLPKPLSKLRNPMSEPVASGGHSGLPHTLYYLMQLIPMISVCLKKKHCYVVAITGLQNVNQLFKKMARCQGEVPFFHLLGSPILTPRVQLKRSVPSKQVFTSDFPGNPYFRRGLVSRSVLFVYKKTFRV